MSNLEILKKISTDEIITTFDPNCIRQKSNWSKIKKEYKMDNEFFDADVFLNDIKNASPKLDALLKKIYDLDRKDEKKHGKKFKHFIFSDLKSGGHGAKMLASALLASGWTLGYKAKMKGEPDDSAKENKGGDNKKNDKNNQYDDDDDEDVKTQWGPIQMLDDQELLKTRGDNFYLLSSISVFNKPISVKMKKEILSKFNSRPDNIYGDLARIIIMDSGFKEGIDLFDIKYIHIFEPSVNAADQKQVIGRGTRTCGQKGLEFNPTKGWPLHVFVYDLEIPGSLQSSLLGATSTFDLFMKAMNIDIRLINFGYDIERLSVIGSVDYELNKAVHDFSVNLEDDDDDEHIVFGGKHLKYGELKNEGSDISGFQKMRKFIRENYGQYKWDTVKMENLCIEKGGNEKKGGAATILNYNDSQQFIRNYFKPTAPVKGMLLHHSVGTGKTASAIAAASTNFEPEGYTILWVTRTTLKNDIWKNMFGQVANEDIRNKIVNGEDIPDDPKKQMRLLSKSWRIRPMSYKQFSNLVSKQNDFYRRLVKENGEADPLRKTLLIIDEAHKLYGGGDLSSIERPDMVALHESLMKSYAVSGNDSVRLLLMTATPITESPMELIQLVNLCKPIDQQMPHTFESFSSEYLDNEGHFTDKGENNYLDNIAGHISYLNRAKDARQFAQPIVKQVMVPIISDSQMEHVKQYDKFLLRTDIDDNLIELKEKSEKANEQMQGELSEMEKERFNYLKKKCSQEFENIPQKKCDKIVSQNIKLLMNEIKTYVKSIKDQVKNINLQVTNATKEKTIGLEKIKRNIERRPEEFENYKNSTYFSLRTICGSRIRTNKELLENLKEHPKIIKYNNEIKKYEDHIEMLKNRLTIDSEAYKIRLKQLRDILRESDLSDLERDVIKLTIKDHQKKFRKTKKIYSREIKDDLEDDVDAIKLINDNKKEVYKNVKKTMKKMMREEHKQEVAAKKEEKRLRKTIRKQSDLKEEIKDEGINEIVNKYEKIIQEDLSESAKDGEKEMKEKMEKQKEKEMKKEASDKAKQEKQIEKQEKQKEKQAKQIEKQEKQKEKQEKLIARKTLKIEKDKAKQNAKIERELKKNKVARKTKKRSPKK